MARFEQRRQFGDLERAELKGVKIPKGHRVVFLENLGNESDLRRQRQIYWGEGYDELHADADGIFMTIPDKEAKENDKRYKKTSEERLRTPAKVGLTHETGSSGLAKPMKGSDFLDQPDNAVYGE